VAAAVSGTVVGSEFYLIYQDKWEDTLGRWYQDCHGRLYATQAAAGTYLIARGPARGTYSVDIVTPATGDFYGGIIVNGYDQGKGWLFRVDSREAASAWRLIKRDPGGDTEYGGVKSAVNGTTYNVELDRTGDVITVTIDGVQFTQQTDGYLQNNELFALFCAANVPSVLYSSLSVPAGSRAITPTVVEMAAYKAAAGRGIVEDLFVVGCDDTQQNHFLGNGIQGGHAPKHQLLFDPAQTHTILLDNDAVRQVFDAGALVHNDTGADDGEATVRMTFYRDRIVVASFLVFDAGSGIDRYGHDIDLLESIMPATFQHNNGGWATYNPLTDWATLAVNQDVPWTTQVVTALNSRITTLFYAIQNAGVGAHDLYARDTDDGWNYAFAANRSNPTLDGATEYITGVVLWPEAAVAYDTAKAQALQDDFTAPYLGVTTGTLDTADGGDVNTDGFNESTGWYTVDADGNEIEVTFDPDGGARSGDAYYSPALKITSWTKPTDPVVQKSTDAGAHWATLTDGTDYVWGVEGGVLYLQYIGEIDAAAVLNVA
jgi:hypothetical protein